ncbi:hypothetical protein FB567DRAFT_578681 [Paraphoma chrysanthemicola]|uniref:Uncharacterized protein n=1 Tax=Paraphoma chrysanthemicola TaxID=798071 RepID=A0A8K0W0N3_9PLEO|nr:hypothetical protein FB567DRAFT_578681 [Paraphoma chrysanthemicola]
MQIRGRNLLYISTHIHADVAEALAALGTTTALLSLVFATVPTIAKAHRDLIECTDQLRIYNLRTSSCEAKIETLLERCMTFRMFEDLGSYHILKAVVEIHTGLNTRLRPYAITDTELDTWRKHKIIPSRISNKIRAHPAKLFHSTLYALYKKRIIDEWVTGMEKAIESLEKLLQAELELQTGGHHIRFDRDAVTETEDVKSFVASITKLGDTLFSGTVGSRNTASIHDWALELQPPSELNDVANWKYAELDLRLSFSGPHSLQERDFAMQVSHRRFDLSAPLSRQQIEQAVLCQVGGTFASDRVPNLKCSTKGRYRRTKPLGRLFREKPELFSDPVWKSDQVHLVHGLINWTLLLWNTRWMDVVCACGLRVERDELNDNHRQFLGLRECSSAHCRGFSVCLRNLGLTLAEIILATQLQSSFFREGFYFEGLNDGTLRRISPEEIAQRVCQKTKSIPFAEAISFCLTDVSKLATGEFKPGYLLRLIEKIYKPILTWYEPESRQTAKRSKLAKRRNDLARQEGWPEAGMELSADPSHPESQIPSVSTVWRGEVVV